MLALPSSPDSSSSDSSALFTKRLQLSSQLLARWTTPVARARYPTEGGAKIPKAPRGPVFVLHTHWTYTQTHTHTHKKKTSTQQEAFVHINR